MGFGGRPCKRLPHARHSGPLLPRTARLGASCCRRESCDPCAPPSSIQPSSRMMKKDDDSDGDKPGCKGEAKDDDVRNEAKAEP